MWKLGRCGRRVIEIRTVQTFRSIRLCDDSLRIGSVEHKTERYKSSISIMEKKFPPRLLSLHHAQVSIPIGSEEEVRKFYCGVLGLKEVAKPASLKDRGGLWVQFGSIQIHFGSENFDRKLTRSHLAYLVDDLQGWKQRLITLGIELQYGVPIPGYDKFEFRDPFGNRVEFLQEIPKL